MSTVTPFTKTELNTSVALMSDLITAKQCVLSQHLAENPGSGGRLTAWQQFADVPSILSGYGADGKQDYKRWRGILKQLGILQGSHFKMISGPRGLRRKYMARKDARKNNQHMKDKFTVMCEENAALRAQLDVYAKTCLKDNVIAALQANVKERDAEITRLLALLQRR